MKKFKCGDVVVLKKGKKSLVVSHYVDDNLVYLNYEKAVKNNEMVQSVYFTLEHLVLHEDQLEVLSPLNEEETDDKNRFKTGDIVKLRNGFKPLVVNSYEKIYDYRNEGVRVRVDFEKYLFTHFDKDHFDIDSEWLHENQLEYF